MTRMACQAVFLAVALALAAGCRTPEQRAPDLLHNILLAGAEKDVNNGQYDRAIHKLRQATALKPEEARTHLLLGNTLVERALQPDANEEAREKLVSQALEAHQTALRLAPKSPQANYHVGRDLILLGRPAESIAYLEQARRRHPTVAYIDARLGDAYRLMNQYDLALQEYRTGLDKRPEPRAAMELHEGIAETHAAQGRTAEALAAFDLARKSAVTDAHRKRIEKRMAELQAPSPP